MPAISKKKRPAKRPEGSFAPPRFIAVQKATLVDAPRTGDEWLHEIKLDGYRVQLRVNKPEVAALTSSGLDWTEKFQTIADAAGQLRVKSAILDGEVAVMRQDGISDFGTLQDAISQGRRDLMTYWAFDLLQLDGNDLTREPLEARKAKLQKLVRRLPQNSRIRYSEHVIGNGAAFYRAACERGLEGIVSKRRAAPYVSGRTDTWLKVKCRHRQEFVITGWKRSDAGGIRSLLLGYYDSGELIYAGNVGTGFKQQTHIDLIKRFQPLETSSTMMKGVPRPDARQARWLKPVLVAEIEFSEWTSDGVLRHPSFKGIRVDKDPKDIRRELPARG